MRFLGWLTADRRVEAKGEAEAHVGERPSSSMVDAVEHEVKRGYDEASASTARTPSRAVPLAAQSRDEPEPYSAPATTTRGTPSDR